MSKILLPAPARFKNYREYFSDFIEKNSKNKSFSQRSFAKKVGWPVSYLNDLVKGRKHLTVSRVLQFSKLFDLNSLHVEKLMGWMMQEALESHSSEKDFFETKVKPKQKAIVTGNLEEKGLEFNPEILSVFEVVQWKKGKVTPFQIQKLLYLYPKLSTEKIKNYLHLLERQKIIRKSKTGEYELLMKSFFWDHFGKLSALQIEQLYHENYVCWLKAPKGPARFSSGLIEVAEEDFPLVQEKLDQLRNQLLTLSRKTASHAGNDRPSDLLQFGISIFPIIDKTQA